MTRVLVTGASGFVGTALVRRLSEEGQDVVAATRDGYEVRGAKSAAVGDIQTAQWLPHLAGIDAVVHLAARVHLMRDPSHDPLAAFRVVNRDATVRLAEACRASGVRRFVFVSSIKAALDETGAAPSDESSPAVPTSPYGISKLEAERALLAIPDLDVVILRPPVVYGPGVKGNIRAFMKLARLGVPLPLATISNRRSLVGLGNLAAALSAAARSPGIGGRTFYVCDETLSTPELFRRLARANGRPARLFAVPVSVLEAGAALAGRRETALRLTRSLAVRADAFQAASGWRPTVTMDVELARMVESGSSRAS